MKKILQAARFIFTLLFVGLVFYWASVYIKHNEILKEIIKRLEADSRAAQVLVTNVHFDENTQKTLTTIKFLEFDSEGQPLEPKYFTFSGNIIQFQALVVRFDDLKVRMADRLKGKSAYLFMKAFVLEEKDTQVFEITKTHEIPEGYKIDRQISDFERGLWQEFWDYALDPGKAYQAGVKNAQIEAPGTMFIPGTLYTIKIEHDGGLRIDAEPLPGILKGEKIL